MYTLIGILHFVSDSRCCLPSTSPALNIAHTDLTLNLLLCNNTHIQSSTDSKLLLSFPTTPCLRFQPPAKQTVLEISLQITLCLPNPPGSEGNQTPAFPCPHRNRPQLHSNRTYSDCILTKMLNVQISLFDLIHF